MTLRFSAAVQPPRHLIESIAALTPTNPFYTPHYAAARAAAGELPCVLALQSQTTTVAGCLGFLHGSVLTRALEISSVPTLVDGDLFWNGVRRFCRQRGVWDLHLESFASTTGAVPALGGELSRRTRREYILDLTCEDPLSRISTNHRRNIARATKAKLHLRRTRDPEACRAHVRLMNASMERRKHRGEDVPTAEEVQPALALLASESGELFQALRDTEVLSSILVMRAQSGGYYQSAGTLPEGMALGASSFLIAGVAEVLKQEGARVFNLGGAGPESPGLERFKAGFGGRVVPLEAAGFALASPLKRKLRTAARLVRHNPMGLLGRLCQIERFVVYAAAPEAVGPAEPGPGVGLAKLSDDAVRQLEESPGFSEQAERFRRLGFNDAYGLFCDGELVHVAWLVSAEHDRSVPGGNVRLRPGEAEITHCVTKGDMRGRGFYPTAIRHLCREAAQHGVRRVFMITGTQNLASQRGIEKAGLSRCSSVFRVLCPSLSSRVALTLRGHRWPRLSRSHGGSARLK